MPSPVGIINGQSTGEDQSSERESVPASTVPKISYNRGNLNSRMRQFKNAFLKHSINGESNWWRDIFSDKIPLYPRTMQEIEAKQQARIIITPQFYPYLINGRSIPWELAYLSSDSQRPSSIGRKNAKGDLAFHVAKTKRKNGCTKASQLCTLLLWQEA
ncbi:hypothetical protein Ancab_019970 [Ancistrocladus abbreviatus]